MNINIQNLILRSIESDDSFSWSNQSNIIRIYQTLSSSEKEKVDSIFIELCGFSLNALLKEMDSTKQESILRETHTEIQI